MLLCHITNLMKTSATHLGHSHVDEGSVYVGASYVSDISGFEAGAIIIQKDTMLWSEQQPNHYNSLPHQLIQRT